MCRCLRRSRNSAKGTCPRRSDWNHHYRQWPRHPTPNLLRLMDFSARVSAREAYVSPTRGLQGNALKRYSGSPSYLMGMLARFGFRPVVFAMIFAFRSIAFAKFPGSSTLHP